MKLQTGKITCSNLWNLRPALFYEADPTPINTNRVKQSPFDK